ncbi:MAG TPA: PsiF family protein [Nitrospira sp.]|nr:phosphate starvation-inducible protein PsiF [Nitrospira sp.]MCC7470535.1 phosphate starvation-inducible protein PsiF [Candidatus Nomurabacteria bacterium]MBS0157748.1 phosphate starvation-inducible protein PsiF [Nitrospira sp.]MBS0161833.1 phosphate starvation-inducible protein PsiF [Nitrospira sp.]MBS0174529.1 phosphate starvation-inducible protein PsiF [Nitrospira sp.]
MKHLTIACFSLMLAAVLVTPQLSFAGAQQNKMKTCNADADAKGLSGEGKGEDRKAFMKECLSAKPAKAAAGTSQQNKMASCNKDAKAKNLAGDERKKFMKTCLSN